MFLMPNTGCTKCETKDECLTIAFSATTDDTSKKMLLKKYLPLKKTHFMFVLLNSVAVVQAEI